MIFLQISFYLLTPFSAIDLGMSCISFFTRCKTSTRSDMQKQIWNVVYYFWKNSALKILLKNLLKIELTFNQFNNKIT